MKRWIILDRDGTLIKDKHYLRAPDGAELAEGAAEGLKSLASRGYRFVVLTNQSGIGRGYFTEDEMRAVHRRVDEMLAREGVRIEGWFHCPHRPEENCSCRKPATGLADEACRALGFSRGDIACVIGDKKSDADLAHALGVPSVLISPNPGADGSAWETRGCICASIAEAAEALRLGDERRAKSAFEEELRAHIEASRAALALEDEIARAADMIVSALRRGGRLFACGNGGSAADAQHMAAELSGRYLAEREALDASALSCNTSALTAIGNDYGFDRIFARQLEAHGRAGDVLLAISTSGNSANVTEAAKFAKKAGIGVIALTGADGGILASFADAAIKAPSRDTPRVQEIHILTEHILCGIAERALCR